jgi:hypothetical protein
VPLVRQALHEAAQGLTLFSCRYYGTGLIFGKMLCIIICVDYILLAFLDFFFPRENIDIAPKFELGRWQEVCLFFLSS